jgi:hypothetical protein
MQKLKKTVVLVLFLILIVQSNAAERGRPDCDDNTLEHYLSKTDVVVIGEVTGGLQRIGIDTESSYAARETRFEFAVSESIKGKLAAQQTIDVTVIRIHDISQEHWSPAQGDKLILFLKASGDSWVTADKWFGAQPYSQAFVEHLKRVQAQVDFPAEDR